MLLLAIDPGLRCTGWAGFEHGRLIACGVSIRARTLTVAHAAEQHALAIPTGFDLAVVEKMIHYAETRPGKVSPQKSNAVANDLIDLSNVGAWIAAKCAKRFALVPAREWKGSRPENVTRKRTKYILTWPEINVMEEGVNATCRGKDENAHNCYDAIGIGLFYLGREKYIKEEDMK